MIKGDIKTVVAQAVPQETEWMDESALTDQGGSVQIVYQFSVSGSIVRRTARFDKVRAYRFTAELYCTGWYFDGEWGALFQVENSSWLRHLLGATSGGHDWPWEINHYMLYIDDDGAYEIAAESFSIGAIEW